MENITANRNSTIASTTQNGQFPRVHDSRLDRFSNHQMSTSSNSPFAAGSKTPHTTATPTSPFNSPSGGRRADTPVKAERPKKRMKLDFSDALCIVVGADPQPQTFFVPANLITSRSNLIKERKTKTGSPIKIPDEDPTAFSIYLQCIYEQHVYGNSVVVDSDVSAEDAWKLLAQIYLIAEKIQDAKTANLVIDELVKRLKAAHDCMQLGPAIKYTFDNSSVDCTLRQLFVEYAVCRNSDRGLIAALARTGGTEFMIAGFTAFMDYRDTSGLDGVGGPSVILNSFGGNVMRYYIRNVEPPQEG